jgi:predicted GNAT superfamily acetyltransferase
MVIRRAEEKDLDRIVEINNQTDWFGGEQKDFFVQFLDNPLFLVSESKNKVSAYTLICDQDYNLDSDNYSFIKKHFNNFYYVIEIAADIKYPIKGSASQLYDYLFSISENTPILGKISLKPLNEKSVQFHKRRDFKLIHKFVYPDFQVCGLYMRWN